MNLRHWSWALIAPVALAVVVPFATTALQSSTSAKSVTTPALGKSNEIQSAELRMTAKVFTSAGWVRPDEVFPQVMLYENGSSVATAVTVSVRLHDAVDFVSASPAATSGDGSAATPLVFNLGDIAADASGKIVILTRAHSLNEDPEIIWKDVSSQVTLSANGAAAGSAVTHGPKVAVLSTARYGDRPFPVVMVQYQDVKHCTGVGEPFPECGGNHTAEALDEAVNSQTSGKSLWQLYQDMSFGQLFPIGQVSPAPGSGTQAFDPDYDHKFSTLAPNGSCTGATLADAWGTPAYSNRIEDGWYTLPGTQNYYGADRTGHALGGSLTGQGLLFGIDDACGPTAKIVYDAASLADPDIDYNELDTDKDGVVDFFNLMFAGDGGNGSTNPTGLNNVWPHKSDLRGYYTDENGLTGYVSNDQLKNHFDQPMYYADERRISLTTENTGIPAFVRVGPYNVNPEAAVEHVSVVGHEYGHSLGLPDFYSTGGRDTFGSWELMASDYFQYMNVFGRQELGWIVPRPLETGTITLRESKFDTGEIHWQRPDGTPYVLTGPGIHNADAYRVDLPTEILIDEVPSGTHAWYSQAGNDFGCPPAGGHNLDVYLPGLAQYPNATNVTLSFKSQYEIEWDYDYAFVLVSADGGRSWESLASSNGTTIDGYNPNQNGCYTTYGNGITGVSGAGDNSVANLERAQGNYPDAVFIDDAFDISAYAGEQIILRFAYSTDPGLAKRGWFIDDLKVTADDSIVYSSDFEAGYDEGTLFPDNWLRASTADALDVDHAYFIELRDRIGNDFDGKLQSERGTPTWEPGVALIYSDEGHGYGNTGVDNPPAQTIVDAAPQSLSDTPNLDDAAFTLGRPLFNSCTHVDNYSSDAAGTLPWIMPKALSFYVAELVGLSADGTMPASPATARVLVQLHPDCDVQVLAPELSVASGYEDPDTDGHFTLGWTRPAGSIGPDIVQRATNFAVLLEDDAENGMGLWVSSTEGVGALDWEVSSVKTHGGSSSFWGRVSEGGTDAASILTSASSFVVPMTGETNLSYWDFYMNESDDFVSLEVSNDDGATWNELNRSARSELANDAALLLAEEAMTQHVFSLAKYRGAEIKIRFRAVVGPENKAGSTPLGWYVDDIRIESSDFADHLQTASTQADLSASSGNYFYRVRSSYGSAQAPFPGPYSNVLPITVAEGVVVEENPTATPAPSAAPGPAGPITQRGGGLDWLVLFMAYLVAGTSARIRSRSK